VGVQACTLSRKGGLHKNNEDRATCLPDFNAYGTSKLGLEVDLSHPLTAQPAPVGSFPPLHSLFAIYDGHGGDTMSAHAAEMLHRHLLLGSNGGIAPLDAEPVPDSPTGTAGSFRTDPEGALLSAFAKVEAELKRYYAKSNDPAGTCAVVALVRGGALWVANVGDSRALLVTISERLEVGVELLSTEQRATLQSERVRIEKSGGFIKDGRAMGNLIPSRTLGDFQIKSKNEEAVISTPEIQRHEIRAQDRFLVLGSDGLFDVLKPGQIAKICAGAKGNPQKAANDLMREVGRKGSTDDTTVIVASLKLES